MVPSVRTWNFVQYQSLSKNYVLLKFFREELMPERCNDLNEAVGPVRGN